MMWEMGEAFEASLSDCKQSIKQFGKLFRGTNCILLWVFDMSNGYNHKIMENGGWMER